MKLTFEQWEEKYHPLGTGGVDGEGRYETYGPDLELVKATADSLVWTEVDGDNGSVVLCSGYHFVNRIAYRICRVPHDGDPIEVVLFEESDFDEQEHD